MTRPARVIAPEFPHHVTARGNHGLDIFEDKIDREVYLGLLQQQSLRHEVRIQAYCLMTNHVHLVITPRTDNGLSCMMRSVQRGYSEYFNHRKLRGGHLWSDRYYSCVLDDDHLRAAVRYVEMNPVHAGMIDRPEDYPWSSAAGHCGLKDAGYQTAHIGKWHLAPYQNGEAFYADHQGFDYVIGGGHLPGPPDYYSPYKNGIRNLKPGPQGEYLNERLAEESIKWIESIKDTGKPFYLNFWHYAVHGPWIPKKDLMPKYQKLRNPQSDQRCPEMATMLESMDTSLGMLLDWLERPENRALNENTVIILTSDNGGITHKELSGGNTVTSNRPLRGGKANTYEGGVPEPWIVSWPGKIKAGTICGAPVQTVDIYPTVLEVAGLKPKPGITIDGQSILPLLKGQPMRHQPIFTDFPHLFGIMCAPSSSVRLGDWKLIRYFHAGKDAGGHAYELFDLKRDPYESIDLSNFLPAKVKELDALIETHLMETQALIPLRNPQFKGDPRSPRWQKMEPGRPRKLSLETNSIHIQTAGSRRFQLLDQDNSPRQTHALVLEGAEWVSTKSNPDGSIEVIYENPEKNATATVLFGWKGGTTCFEINDWTIPPCKLVLNPKKE